MNYKKRKETILDIPIPKNPYKSEGISDKEFKEEVLNVRRENKKRRGGYFRMGQH